ncbi:uncharacterized protein LOC107042431 isoform X2 [Diachasma alloeum]|uniref:uncharacterized protein LOC107042431 isoform X2 n=1 Tax=Diachasma alloeum TaxID=454923 RepID=UPI00073827FE|nr:uncharacterized protein LOC107042431 isoform X2 [Diachasma alloeum]
MASTKIKYTSSKAIDHFNAGATLMRIVGYVDSIEGLRELPKSASKWIYKCVLNNNDDKKVRIIFWGDDALKYNSEIVMYQIIKITGGVIKEANLQYRRSGDTVSDKEFQFGRGSTLEVLGTFDIANGADEALNKVVKYQSIEIKDVCSARGPVEISGWLKEPFRSISTASGASYGSAMICSEVHRMTVHVTTFVPNENLLEGMKIKIRGTIDRRSNAFVLNTATMDQVSIIPGAPTMTEDEMDEAVESPPLVLKRESEDIMEITIEKKQKCD